MKVHRHLLRAAWLAVCVLLLLSACGGPTPIAGRLTETVTPASPTTGVPSTKPPESTGSPTADVSPSPAATATDAPLTPPPETPPPPATPTGTPTPSATDTPVPDETPTPTPTAEVTAPVIEGLKLVDGTYVAEKGNPYGVKAGEVVGHPTSVQVKGLGSSRVRNPDGTFEEVGFVQQSAVVISNPKVLAYVTNKENTPEKVRAGEWKIALPFEPGPDTKIWELTFPDYIGNQPYMAVSGLPQNNVIVNPFSQSVLAKSYPLQNGVFDVGLFLPDSVAPERGINYTLSIIYSSAGQVFVDNSGKHMNPGAQLIQNITGQVPKLWAPNAQAVFAVGSLKGTKDFGIARHVLTLGDSFVFAGAK